MTTNTQEPIDARQLVRMDPALEAGQVDAITSEFSGPNLSAIRQELNALQSEIDSGSEKSPGMLTRAGILSYLMGKHQTAIADLNQVSGSGPASYYAALAYSAMERHEEAAQKFDEAAKNGYDRIQCTLLKAGAVRALGRVDEAETILRGIATEAVRRAEYSYQMGCIWSDKLDSYAAIEHFERAVDMDPHHSRALFRLAVENSNRGNDAEAVRLYEQALSKPPYYLGAMINLGLLYEDAENYAAAAYCFRRVLEVDPNHPRAVLYLKDIEATDNMYYDEESARNEARLEQLLNRPVTDFELSVRSRNCLEGMDIYTLGDLTRISEQDLLSGKNFGETSLHEIREIMAAHGLMIGQNLRSTVSDYSFSTAPSALSPQEQAEYNRPISDLNLSVRARKCMTRLGITTIGELVVRTADELLGSRNFGVTSLNEVRAKLAENNLKLRND
ncbi:MAG: DNA-directed RNA polymerase subunit alpha C-terminal domain-containing protein [Planctomycetaceae bacterium]